MDTETPKRKLVLEFTKMHGAGNDFVVLDNRFYNFTDEELADLTRRLCPRRTGIGADGLLALARPEDASVDYRMRYFNADGSRATMCGNGARCLAGFARRAGLEKTELTFASDAGTYRVQVPEEEGSSVRLFVPSPRHFSADRAFESEAAHALAPLYYVWTGTEHVVTFVDELGAAPVRTKGRAVRRDPALLPAGANVNFVQVARAGGEQAVLRVRTYEKGVEEETQACGTGALAAAATARYTDRITADSADVEMPGGRLTVGFRYAEGTISDLYLEGPVTTVFRGTTEVS